MNQETTNDLTAVTQERDQLRSQLAKLKERRFPVMHHRNRFPEAPGFIPWSVIEHHEACAQQNHRQSLDGLAQRGGLDPTEALAVMTNQSVVDLLRQKLPDAEVVAKLKEAITKQSSLPIGNAEDSLYQGMLDLLDCSSCDANVFVDGQCIFCAGSLTEGHDESCEWRSARAALDVYRVSRSGRNSQ